MPTALLESASARCVRCAIVQSADKVSAFLEEYPLGRSPSSVLLPPTGRKTDISKLAPPESRRLAERTQKDDDWEQVIRKPSPRNPNQKKSQVRIKRRQKEDEVFLLCVSEGREAKDRAIREKQEQQLKEYLEALQTRVKTGNLKKAEKIHEAIGRLRERYPRVARYYQIEYEAERKIFSWQEDVDKKAIAKKLDGGYVMKTDRQDLTADEIWRTYMLLTRVEAAFRAMKSPLLERPIFHHLQDRTQTHIFLCVLAYHLPVSIEKRFLDRDIHTSWWTLRQQLSTHQVVTVVLPTLEGKILKIRKATTPEPVHRECEDGAALNLGKTLFKRQKPGYLPPPSGVAEVGKIKSLTSSVLQSGKPGPEGKRRCFRPR